MTGKPLRYRLTGAGVVLLLMGGLAACGGSGSAGQSGSGGLLKVKEGSIGGDISFEMQAVADTQRIFEKQGLDVQDITTSSGVTATQALIAGQLDVVNAGGGEVLAALAKGADIKIVAPLLNAFPYYLIGGKGIKSVSDIKGKSVAISTTGSSSYYGATTALTALGLHRGDYKIQQVGGESDRLAAVASGSVAATVVGAQLIGKIKQLGLSVLSNLANAKILFAQDYMVASGAFIKAHPGFVAKYRKGLEQARAFMEDPANKSETLAAFGKDFEVPASSGVAQAAYDYTQQEKGSPLFFPPGLPLSKQVFQHTMSVAGLSNSNLTLANVAAEGVPVAS
ncbi:MAG: ABC transporter substrate-binding protein [Nocardiopsaceae bacterium]|jgi:ABC-type nitrate/sulfonate/bicarbonate transport system substrate-binding protein|nr:ABC transporter substrate-binding protein [Nocardiopsaceae bacterium]